MSKQQLLLPRLIDTCAAIHQACGVVLIGSVARGDEIADSDIDLNLIFPGDDRPLHVSSYVDEQNRWQLCHKDTIEGIRIDIAWETEAALHRRLAGDDIVNCWPLSKGKVLRDPANVAGPCVTLARNWFAEHPEENDRRQESYNAAKLQQRQARAAQRQNPPSDAR